MAELIVIMVAKYGVWGLIVDGTILVLAILVLKAMRERAD